MDIARLSMDMSSTSALQSVQISMLKNTMEQAEQTGAQFAEMIKTADVSEGSTIDIKI
ncbi:MAG: YjfB family protein [Clostridiales bacterium]|jgi:ribosomal protein L18|nr:YjfB family protein [Clostridiales bacterium]